jgi:hypothetical protein
MRLSRTEQSVIVFKSDKQQSARPMLIMTTEYIDADLTLGQ